MRGKLEEYGSRSDDDDLKRSEKDGRMLDGRYD
jgi:hypothetical protein